MPFWEYEVPSEEREMIFEKLKPYAKPNVQLTGKHFGEAWSVETTGLSRLRDEDTIFIEVRDKRWSGLATYQFSRKTGFFEITDSDFPYPLEFIILRDYLKIDTRKWKLLRSG